MGVVPRIDERSALIVWVATSSFLIGALLFGETSIFAYSFGGRIIGSNFLSFMMGRALTFHRCHGGISDRSGWVKVFEEKDTVKKKRNKKAFCVSDVKGKSLSIDDINADTKGCNGSSIR